MIDWLIDWVKVLHPARHKIGYFGDVLPIQSFGIVLKKLNLTQKSTHTQINYIVRTTTTVLWPFVWDYMGEPVPEETLIHPPSWSSSNLYQLPSTTIHSILVVQITCLAIFLHNLFPCPLWSASWSGALHLIFHTFLHPNKLSHKIIPKSLI